MRKIISASILIVVVIVAIIIYSNSNKQFVNVTTIKNQYNVVSDDSNIHLKIPLYFDYYDSYYTNINNYSSCNIQTEDFEFKLDLDAITYEKEEYLNKTKYYVYIFEFTCTLNEGEIKVPNCHITINYNNNITLNEEIGSICLTKVNKFLDDNISISKLKAITSFINGRTTLSAIVIELDTKKDITLKSFEIFDAKSSASFSEAILVSEFDVENDINNVLGYQYSNTEIISSNNSIKLKAGKSVLVVPIKNSAYLSRCGFKMTYTDSINLAYDFYYKDYIFFQEVMLSNTYISQLEYHEYKM